MVKRVKITLELTPTQAKVVYNTLDGAADAGSCEGGCTRQELNALQQVTMKLLNVRADWLHIKLKAG